jgi:hypothetical protein
MCSGRSRAAQTGEARHESFRRDAENVAVCVGAGGGEGAKSNETAQNIVPVGPIKFEDFATRPWASKSDDFAPISRPLSGPQCRFIT